MHDPPPPPQSCRSSYASIVEELYFSIYPCYKIIVLGVEPEPFEIGEHLVEASNKLVLIDQLLAYLKSRGHKVLMFSQMTHMLDILQDYLGYRGIRFFPNNETTFSVAL